MSGHEHDDPGWAADCHDCHVEGEWPKDPGCHDCHRMLGEPDPACDDCGEANALMWEQLMVAH